ncbi:MAG: CoA transferase [Gemmatimonadetes bacterium]|nr:CoA transferase [Gemmatimonadota bacterium]
MTLPLEGLRVVAVEQAVSAPFCTRQLADMGADVIKVERPDVGDFAREYDHVLRGESAYFAWLNRGKRSVELDIRSEPGRSQLGALVRGADVFVHNLVPGAVERLGLGYDTLQAVAPRLVWVGISGFGPDGPYRDRKAYDMLVQAEAGIVSVTGTADAPAKVGISIADIGSGMYAYSSILAALLRRAQTGEGSRIDISMFECMTEWMVPPLYTWLGAGRVPARAGVRHNMIVPYGAYACADGDVLFAIQSDGEFRRLATAVLLQAELADDPRFATNAERLEHRALLEALIEGVFSALTAAEVVARLDAAGLASARVNDVPAVAGHPQLAARGRWVEVGSPSGVIPALRPPHNIAGVESAMGRVPALGEHTADVLATLDSLRDGT